MGRRALVTGANRGIGREACRQLAEAGLDVVLTSRNPEAGRRAAAELGLPWARLDVSDAASVAECAGDHPELDVLVNNAGVLLDEAEPALELDEDTLRATFEANFFGAFRACRAWLPGMVDRGYGRVVNVSSGAGSIAEMTSYAPAYSVSKAALNALTRTLAFDARGDVKVNTMSPGWVRTDMGGPAAPRSVEEAVDTLVWLGTLPSDGPSGGFFSDRRQRAW